MTMITPAGQVGPHAPAGADAWQAYVLSSPAGTPFHRLQWLDAVERRVRLLDLNRSRRDNHGSHAFKRYHGFEPTPLHYRIVLNKADRPPDLSPSNSRFALAGRPWRKLPLRLTRPTGGLITKSTP